MHVYLPSRRVAILESLVYISTGTEIVPNIHVRNIANNPSEKNEDHINPKVSFISPIIRRLIYM